MSFHQQNGFGRLWYLLESRWRGIYCLVLSLVCVQLCTGSHSVSTPIVALGQTLSLKWVVCHQKDTSAASNWSKL